MKISFSIYKNDQIYKLNRKHQGPRHLLHLDQVADMFHRLLKREAGLVVSVMFTCITKRHRVSIIHYQELAKGKKKYGDRFELNNIVYIKERYSYI